MTIFYEVDPSDVRRQTKEFGEVFKKTCSRKTKEERQRWSQALTDAANIAGEDLKTWDTEANMIETIAKDVLNKLNATPCRDFNGIVGLEAHLTEMQSLLDLDNDGVKIVAITGPAGIGKTTIARALYCQLSCSFHLTCFVDNLRENYRSGFDEHGLKLHLQEQFLSKVLNHNGMRICHLGAIKENLCDQKVLIILDDVNNLKQLEALANEPNWFGPGSRIVVTTENKELLQQHGINNTYHVEFPSYEQALKILCRYAFGQSYPHSGFEELAARVTELCGNLPLSLCVVGSLLRGKEEDEWEDVMKRLETILDRDIEDVLRVGYDSLEENEQKLFLHIAVFFNNEHGDLVKAMFADGDLDVKRGLKILVNRSLIYITDVIVMHKLLRQMARQAIRKQEPWKRQVLLDAHEICHVLENETGTSVVSGISFDTSGIKELIIGERAFKRLSHLQFLSVYKSRDDGNDIMKIPEEMEFPCRLRLLHWEAYPRKSLPLKFHLGYLVELSMKNSKLEYLWQGTQHLQNLKKIDLTRSCHLKELPDFSNATNLEELNMSHCENLVEIPSSFWHLQRLQKLTMVNCRKLQVTPQHLNLASLEFINIRRCSKLRTFPVISTNFKYVDISETLFEDVPPSTMLCFRIERLIIGKCGNLKGITHLPTSIWWLDLSGSSIEKIPDCIKSLHRLKLLFLSGCRRLTSLPELAGSVKVLVAEECESLDTVFFPLNHTRDADLNFTNCFKLGEQAQRTIIQSSLFCGKVILPGKEVPAKFDHRASGNSLTIPLVPHSALSRVKICVVVSPNHQISEYSAYTQQLLCHKIGNGDLDFGEEEIYLGIVSEYRAEHLVIFESGLPFIDPSEVSREIVLEFSSTNHSFSIIECGAHVWTGDHTNGVLCEEILEGEQLTDCWSWFFLCFWTKTIEAGSC